MENMVILKKHNNTHRIEKKKKKQLNSTVQTLSNSLRESNNTDGNYKLFFLKLHHTRTQRVPDKEFQSVRPGNS